MDKFMEKFLADEEEYRRNKAEFDEKYRNVRIEPTTWKGKLKCFLSPSWRKEQAETKRREKKWQKDYTRLLPVSEALNHTLRERSLTVSLTSFPARIGCVAAVVGSILRQTFLPDRVVLTLARAQFPDGLPEELERLVRQGILELIWTKDDLKPHKKYFYAMQRYPEDVIVTVDDDVIYPARLLETLWESYLKFPHCVSCMRAHKMRFDQTGKLLPYLAWTHEYNYQKNVPSDQLLATGGGGVLYPPHLLPKETFQAKVIQETCLFGDDLWLKVMEVLGGGKVVLCGDSKLPQLTFQGAQKVSLSKNNIGKNENDVQLAAILRLYPQDQSGKPMTERMNEIE